MKIATWNLERLKHKSGLDKIIALIEELNADILVLAQLCRNYVEENNTK